MNNNDIQTDVEVKPRNKFWHSIFYRKMPVYEDESGHVTTYVEKKMGLAPVFVAIVVIIFIACCFVIPKPHNVSLNELGSIVNQLFKPSPWSLKTTEKWWDFLFNTAFLRIWQTIEMIFVATVFGTILAVPFYILASRNIVRNNVVNQIVRFFVNIIRTIPTFVLAVIGTIFFGFSVTAGVVAMTLFTFGIIFKLMYEYIETCDMNPYEVSQSNGATTLQAYKLSIHPQIYPMFLSNFIYTFEINIRASVVLGFVGAGGVGQLLSDALESTQYDKVGAILIPLLIVVFALQMLSSFLRRKIS